MEDVREEEAVQPLVGEVDADLLEAVDRERLEAEDVEQPDDLLGEARPRHGALQAAAPRGRHSARRTQRAAQRGGRELRVELLHVEEEEPLVDGLGHRVAHLPRLGGREGDADLLAWPRRDPALGELQQQLPGSVLQRRRRRVERLLPRRVEHGLILPFEGDVAQVQDGCEHLEQRVAPAQRRARRQCAHARVQLGELAHLIAERVGRRLGVAVLRRLAEAWSGSGLGLGLGLGLG